jgi:hypothetical protein
MHTQVTCTFHKLKHEVEHADAFLSVLISCDSLSDPRAAAVWVLYVVCRAASANQITRNQGSHSDVVNKRAELEFCEMPTLIGFCS